MRKPRDLKIRGYILATIDSYNAVSFDGLAIENLSGKELDKICDWLKDYYCWQLEQRKKATKE